MGKNQKTKKWKCTKHGTLLSNGLFFWFEQNSIANSVLVSVSGISLVSISLELNIIFWKNILIHTSAIQTVTVKTKINIQLHFA